MDKIINILIVLIFFVLTTDEKVNFLTKYFRIRFFERSFLMFLFLIKILFTVAMITYRVVISIKEAKLRRQEEKEIAQLKQEQELKKKLEQKTKIDPKAVIDLKAVEEVSSRKYISESQLEDRKRIIKSNNISSKQKRKQERRELRDEERLKKDIKMKNRNGIRRRVDERKAEPDLGDIKFKM